MFLLLRFTDGEQHKAPELDMITVRNQQGA